MTKLSYRAPACARAACAAGSGSGGFGPITHQPKGAFRTNDAEQIRTAVLADLGIAHTPGWLFASEIASGAVRPGGRFLASKVRVFIDFLAEIFAQDPSLVL